MGWRLFSARQQKPKGDEHWQWLTQAVAQWFDEPEGQAWLALEQRVLMRELGRASSTGHYLLHYGPQRGKPVVLPGMAFNLRLGPNLPGVDIRCTEHEWPIAEYSIDTLVLQHALEFSQFPRQLLHEATRCIRPGGHLLIFGINPWSLWGIHHRLKPQQPLWHGRRFRAGRVCRWLREMGFAVEKRCYSGYSTRPLPEAEGNAEVSWLERHQWPVGGFYLLVARKLMVEIHPWRKERRERLIGRQLVPLAFRTRRTAKAIIRKSCEDRLERCHY